MATKAEKEKNPTGVGSLMTRFSKTSSEDDDIAVEGPEGARRQPFPRVSQDPLPRTEAPSLPGPPMGAGSAAPGDGAAYSPAWGGDRSTDSLLAAPRPPGEDPRLAAAEPTSTHTSLQPRPLPQGPAPNLTVSPGSGWGRAKGVDSGAQAGRRAPRSGPGPPDASTQTQWVTKAGSVSAPRLPGLRRASGSSLGGREDSTSRFPQCWTCPLPCTGAASRFGGPLPQPVRPQVRAGDERINRLCNSHQSIW